jgi:hypothetical protein
MFIEADLSPDIPIGRAPVTGQRDEPHVRERWVGSDATCDFESVHFGQTDIEDGD